MQCPTPLYIADPNAKHASTRISVPCGKCGSCRQNRRQEWAFRLQQELRQAKSAYFITLTYDDEHIPFNPDTGIITLCKRDVQLYIKRLRKHQAGNKKSSIRYYAVGEYGSATNRPHYHAIVYNLLPATLTQIDRLWTSGHTHVGPVTDASIMYTAKYHVNAVKTDNPDRQPEFALMSRKPALGASYLDSTKDWHKNYQTFYVVDNQGKKINMPRYYREKIFDENERKRHADKTREQIQYNYEKEREKLLKLGRSEQEVDSILQRRGISAAKSVRDKSRKQDKL